jgi:ferritin
MGFGKINNWRDLEMKISEKIERLLNEQINKEFYSEYLYLSMAAFFESQSLKGFSHWLKKQAEEEHKHGMKIYDFLGERLGKVTLTLINAPKIEWKSALNAFEDALNHEVSITESINKIMAESEGTGDRATTIFLQWFINEQIEEEAQADEIVQKLKMTGVSNSGLLVLDHHVGKRE